MQYAVLGKTGLEVSRLGFGCMRLPMKSETEIDRSLAIPLLHRAVELGVTYFDTAVGYCAGDSQRVLGEAMESMREKVVLSTKNHHYDKADRDGWWKNLNDSLERLRTDHIDIYNFHGLNYERFEASLEGEDGLYREVLKAKEQGLIRHICHSFHGSLESLKKCVETGLFESVTVQYNLLDQSLEEGIAYAAEHGMGVVIMGPVGGGRLGYPTGRAQEIAGEVKSTPELALRFVLSNDHVQVALSGMSTMEQLEENVATVANLGALTSEDHRKIEEAVEERKKLAGLYCTGCNYCMPCPDAVDIPGNFEILNLERVFGLTDHARSRYAALGGKAALCRQCGKCVELCPQELDIPTRLGEAVALLDERSGSVAGWGEIRGGESLDDGAVAVKLRYQVKNFTESDYSSAAVELRPHREDQVSPGAFDFGALKAFGRRHRDITVRSLPPVEAVQIDSIIAFDGSHTVEHLSFNVISASRRSGSFNAASNEAGALTKRPKAPYVHVPAATHPAWASPAKLKRHGIDFAASYDDEYLYLWADVEDDLASPATSEPVGRMTNDHLRFYLDGREGGRLGLGGYGDGVFHLTIVPSADATAAPFVKTSNGIEVSTGYERSADGYVVGCAVPWTAFGRVSAEEGATTADSAAAAAVLPVLGFDVALVSHDAGGAETLRLAWTGRERQDRDTSVFGRLVTV